MAKEKREQAEPGAVKKRWELIYDAFPDPIALIGRDYRMVWVNRAMAHRLEVPPEACAGRYCFRMVHGTEAPVETCPHSALLADGKSHSTEVRNEKLGGYFRVTVSPFLDAEGHFTGSIHIMRDITERKQAEEALREREAHYRAMVEAFDGFIYICSQDYRVEFMNRRFIERTGHDARGEFCYRALHDLDDVCPWCVNERVFQGETVRWEVQSPKDNRWFYIVNTPIYHTDGSISKQAMILDISERKRMEEALKKSLEKTKLFAYSVSHDLKSPAIGIYGLAKRLHRSYADVLGEKGRITCEQILNAAGHISDLVAQINVYLSTQAAVLRFEEIKLRDIFQMVREEFTSQLDLRQVAWSVPNQLPVVRGDRIALLRVFRNLVDNALKYGGDALTEIRLDHRDCGRFHVLSLSNDGALIREDHLEKIFWPFQRSETAGEVKGSGLGLAIVKELVEQHGGEVRVESGLGKWTTFHISLNKDPRFIIPGPELSE